MNALKAIDAELARAAFDWPSGPELGDLSDDELERYTADVSVAAQQAERFLEEALREVVRRRAAALRASGVCRR